MNYLMIIGLVVMAIGIAVLSSKKERKSTFTSILSIINIVLGALLIIWGFVQE